MKRKNILLKRRCRTMLEVFLLILFTVLLLLLISLKYRSYRSRHFHIHKKTKTLTVREAKHHMNEPSTSKKDSKTVNSKMKTSKVHKKKLIKTLLPPQTKKDSQRDISINRIKPVVVIKRETAYSYKEYSMCFQSMFANVTQRKRYASLTFFEKENIIRVLCFKKLFVTGYLKCNWPAKNLVGFLKVDTINSPVQSNDLLFVKNGGKWSPENCISRERVAIIIPFRDRHEHLQILLKQLHSVLYRQNLSYRIFVIDQIDEYPFNRGKLMNVGYKEASNRFPYTCFVFHDVDLIPENDFNFYGCPTSPRHLSVAVDKFGYQLPYNEIFGGVEMFTEEHFKNINGFPNTFWGWGAEDDNLYNRITAKGLHLTRPTDEEGRYTMIKHNESSEKPPNRHDKLNNAVFEMHEDGISSLQYIVSQTRNERYFTHIKVDLNMEEDMIY